jgi:RNA polymerase sigma-70 factor (ECF subfamily)
VPRGTGDPSPPLAPYVGCEQRASNVIAPCRTAPVPAPDADLLAATARGDRHAYAVLHHRHAPLLLGLLHRILGSRAEAEDVLQDVFLQIWRKAGDFDERRGRPLQWLTTLARSRALDRLSVLTARGRCDAMRARLEAGEPAVADPVDDAAGAEDARGLRQALAQIPEAQRRVLLLAYFEGLSQSEIACRLGVPLGTVKSNARLGLTKLRDLLAAGGLEPRTRRA